MAADAESQTSPAAVAGTPELLDGGRLSLLVEIARITTSGDPGRTLADVASTLRRDGGFDVVAIAERTPTDLVIRHVDGATERQAAAVKLDARLVEVCLRDGRPIAAPRSRLTAVPAGRWRGSPWDTGAVEVYVPIRGKDGPWGVLLVMSPPDRPLGRQDLDLLQLVGDRLGVAIENWRLADRLHARLEQGQELARVTTDLSSQLDLPAIMNSLLEHAIALFAADRGAVLELAADGSMVVNFARNLSSRFVDSVASVEAKPTLAGEVMDRRGAIVVQDFANDPRSGGLHDAIVEEGFDTIALAPLVAEGQVLGLLAVYHDRRHEWARDDVNVLEVLGAQAGIAMRNAHNYEQMVAWAAQLQSIQQLGSRLTRLTTVTEIGQAIANELRELIDFHNVRVYRAHGQELVPVAWRGEIGEYRAEDFELLRTRIGAGITGWVAEHGVAQYLPDAANDSRAATLAGTEPDIPESMLLAPMLYEDGVIGVIVLSKLGLDQFKGNDELRLLEIYASLAAQAMVNADATERLRAQSERLSRQVANQREMMHMTESILSTLDPRVVMEGITDRLGELVKVDTVAIDILEANTHLLRPIFATGVNADRYMAEERGDGEGLSGWVASHGEAQLVQDRLSDPRVVPFDLADPEPGALIIAPLRARDQVTGVLILERCGPGAHFDEEEFELIQLFSGHVSIALHNAMAHQAVEIRAQTDSLTGLKNHGTFVEYLNLAVARALPFSLLLVDLDDFKAFNDRRGHEAGSQLLTAIAGAIRTSCRDTDEVFRYGGDEFAVILPSTETAGALAVASKLGEAVRLVTTPGTRRRSGVTCSVGVASFPTDTVDRSDLIVAADRACYLAKRLGGDRAATVAMVDESGSPDDGESRVTKPMTAGDRA